MRILGIHDGHNASICVLEDGRITFAAQEERYCQIKNFSGFPEKAVQNAIAYLGLGSIKDMDYVVFAGNHMPYPKDRYELMEEYKETGSLKTKVKRLLKKTAIKTVYHAKRRSERLHNVMAMGYPEEKVLFTEHHHSHASSAYYGWGKMNEDILVLTNDGAGDGLCAAVNIGRNGKLERIASIPESESIGNIYSMVTFIMGMVPLEHEYKLMGMAPYAEDKYAKRVFNKLYDLMEFEGPDGMTWRRKGDCPPTYYSYDFFKELLELERFDSICGGLQQFTEYMLVKWVKNCIEKTGIKKVALSGGVFMNVKANKLISELDGLEDIFIFPSCGDETNPFGAVYDVYAKMSQSLPEPLSVLYLGRDYKSGIDNAIKSLDASLSYERSNDIEKDIAGLLAKGEVVARFKDRAEFGARALGNRSILADASNRDVVKVINKMIKCRDFWMPFACSVLDKEAGCYLANPKDIKAPYMILCFDTTDKSQEIIAGIHPEDMTVRPQIVSKDHNPDYYRLLEKFKSLTGRGAILNTSFNQHGFPIVETPEEAIKVMKDSGLKYLALGDYLIKKT